MCPSEVVEKRLTFWDHEARLHAALEELAAAEADGREPSEEVALAVRDYTLTAAEKRDRMAGFLRQAEKQADLYDEEIARLRAKKATLENAVTRLKSYIVGTMQALDIRKVEGTVVTLALRQNPAHVDVGGEVPPEYQRVIPEKREPDKVAIKKALEAGESVTNCRLVEGNWRLEVK